MPISPETQCQLSTYEQPLNERIRLFMRLESMFFQMKNFHRADEYYSIQLFLDALFDVLDFLHRYEIRSEIIKELQGLLLVHTVHIMGDRRAKGKFSRRKAAGNGYSDRVYRGL